jgi:hypothetical protein
MAKKPLDVIKRGLHKLKSQFQDRRKDLLARLSRKEKLSPEDEEWLDHDANLVDEEALVDALNCLSIEELLNPERENEIIDVDITDEEISAAVHAKREALQNLEINGGDDDDDIEVIEKPNRREALAASLTLQRYISDISDPFARQLEVILASFGRQTRLEETQSLQPSQITDYFGSNRSIVA